MSDTSMQGKIGIIAGVANDRSIAWAVTRAVLHAGAKVVLCVHPQVSGMVKALVSKLSEAEAHQILGIFSMDVSKDEDMHGIKSAVAEYTQHIDFFVHSLAFSDKRGLQERYISVPRECFTLAMDVSCFSFTAMCAQLEDMMSEGCSCLTMTYLGSTRVVPRYNMMGVAKAALEASVRYLARDLGGAKGIRVNALSPGPIRTLAAMGIPKFGDMLKANLENTVLRRNISQEEVGKAARFLLSDDASGITASVIYVDCGAHAVV